MIQKWIEFLVSLAVLMLSFHFMLNLGRQGTEKAVRGYFMYLFVVVIVLVVLCFFL